MTKDQALFLWGILIAAAPGRELSEDDVDVRADLITDLDATEAHAAAVRLARTARWLPSVAEFREAVCAPTLPDAGEAWAEVTRVVHRLGWTTPPTERDFSDPLILRAVQALGTWPDFCAADEMINRAHFLKVYPALAERARQYAVAGPPVHPELGTGPALPLPDLRLARDDRL